MPEDISKKIKENLCPLIYFIQLFYLNLFVIIKAQIKTLNQLMLACGYRWLQQLARCGCTG